MAPSHKTDQISRPNYLCSLLSISQKDNNNYKERFKLINSISYHDNNDTKANIEGIYFLGIIPAKTLPCAYIPFNYNNKKVEYNNRKLNKNNNIEGSKYLNIWSTSGGTEAPAYTLDASACSPPTQKTPDQKATEIETIKNSLESELTTALTELSDNKSEFNIDTSGFLINLLIIWGMVILFIKIILNYYYPYYYNYFLIAIVFILLVTAIILKMINTIRN